ncbi:hypothetical protein [Catenovulum adriaticum]|uniref:Killing trait domain-containing protein n=1 Tax=Catenovulum adriaticum TaxID=2984846 RepID=A0ABY7AJJ6_9ALTE|nr:hypothetical protein [Catenovulum sp. TS8]WAJ69510.1 hypothetical protein OLW01_10040 [Catenovulum sp. TS8]
MIPSISTQTNPLSNQATPVNNNLTSSSETIKSNNTISAEQAQALMQKITQAKPNELLNSVNVSQLHSNQTFSLMA